MNERLDLELDEIKRFLADLDARLHAIEANATPPVAGEIDPAIQLVASINARVHMLEAKVTRLQMFSLDRPGGPSTATKNGGKP